MSDIKQFLNATIGYALPTFPETVDPEEYGGTEFPSIGDIVLSPHDKLIEDGFIKYDQLICDGSIVDVYTHPLYWESVEDYTWVTTTETHSTLGSDGNSGIVGNGDFFWVSNEDTDLLHRYSKEWEYLGTTMSLSTSHQGLGWSVDDGVEHIWEMVLSPLSCVQYTTEGVATGLVITPPYAPRGLVRWGDYYYVVSGATDRVYKMSLTGTLIESYSAIAGQPRGISTDGKYLYISDQNTNRVNILTLAGVFTKYVECSTFTVATGGVFYDPTTELLWVLDYGSTNSTVDKYIKVKNRPTLTTTVGGVPYRVIADLTEE